MATCEKCGYWLSLAPGFAIPPKHAGCGGHYLPAKPVKAIAKTVSKSTTPRTDAVALAPYKTAQEYMKAMTLLARTLERELAGPNKQPEKKFDDSLPLGVISRGPPNLNSLSDDEMEISFAACRKEQETYMQEIMRPAHPLPGNWWQFWK